MTHEQGAGAGTGDVVEALEAARRALESGNVDPRELLALVAARAVSSAPPVPAKSEKKAPGKSKKKKRRSRSPHPGVKLVKRARLGVVTWYARHVDPDTGRLKDVNLSALRHTTDEARREFAERLSKADAKRRDALATGAARHTGGELAASLESFLAGVTNAATRRTYGEGVRRFASWAAGAGLTSTDDVHPHHLAQFREWLKTTPRYAPASGKGNGQGARRVGAEPAKATSINNRLRSVKAALNALRKLGRLPHVNALDIRERLEALPTDEDPPEFLRGPDVRRLLAAALRHDADTFDVTRDEHAREGLGYARQRAAAEARAAGLPLEAAALPTGSTPRYQPVAPFVLAALLGGMREGELERLTWDMVDVDARDAQGRTAGELRLPASATKTRKARDVDLGIAPALRSLLVALRLRSGGATGPVFSWTRDAVEAARKRLVGSFGAPKFSWQALRSTCETYHANMPGVGSAAYQAARRVGNSVAVAERFYLGLVKGLPLDARTLEEAMGVVDLAGRIVRAASGERVDVSDLPALPAKRKRGAAAS